jgi:hypothetical protein
MVFINDPVSGVSLSLNAQERTGTRFAPEINSGIRRQFRDAPGPEQPRRMGRPGAATQNFKTESLGRQTVEGVPADGRRTTITIPAGQAGNDLPIQITHETWYSPDLGTTVLSKHSDPRLGETVTRLTNIARAEPPHALFEVPADFKMAEAPKR